MFVNDDFKCKCSFTNCLCQQLSEKFDDQSLGAGESEEMKWSDIAKHLKLSYDPVLDYHPQYDSYKLGTEIKQADAVLIGYPLGYQMNEYE